MSDWWSHCSDNARVELLNPDRKLEHATCFEASEARLFVQAHLVVEQERLVRVKAH